MVTVELTPANLDEQGTVTVKEMQLVVHETPDEVANAAATEIATEISATEGAFTFGLAGGSTPEATYRALRARPGQWPDVHAWLSDERWVDPSHERSNGRMASESFLDHVEATLHRPEWDGSIEASESAERYEATIRSLHRERRPDLILLGVGADGHTASLFPGTRALSETSRWIVANDVPELGETRITATFPLIWAARRVLVLVTGAHKAQAVKASLEGASPAGRLGGGEAEVEWHVDRAAASLVS